VQAYSRSFGVPIDEVDKARRQVGKIQELALGFHGGVNALVNMAISNGLDPADMVEPVMATAKGAAINRATDEYSWARANGRHCGLPLEQYAALAVIRSSWRDAHPNVVKLWGALERAALAAIRTPGETYPAGSKLRLSVRSFKGHSWLLMRLPSGRFLAYFNPRIVERQGRPVITFWDTDPYTGIWCEQQTYSGKLAENATQASSRCVLFDALYRAEAIEQIPIVTHVHDELVSERERAFLTPSLVELLPVNPSWCPDLPLAATGFIDARYHK
jgi:DNA polymerase